MVGAGFEKKTFYCEPKPEKGPVQIVYAGKLSRAKGVPWLLAALKKVTAPDYCLHLAGAGSGEEKQECLALAADLDSWVKVHGPLSHESLARLVRKAHLFVLPSFFEGLPLVLMEALSSGCRILTTALPGTREIFEQTRSGMVDLLELPALETVDTPFQKDMPALEQTLAHALEINITKADQNRQPDLSQVNSVNLLPILGKAYSLKWKKSIKRFAIPNREKSLNTRSQGVIYTICVSTIWMNQYQRWCSPRS